MNENQCNSTAPFCRIIYTDESTAPPTITGVCVQCRDDCDCPVNTYCGTDYILPSPAFKLSKNASMTAKLHSQAMAGFSIPSKCMA
jgi:hypothetical protein